MLDTIKKNLEKEGEIFLKVKVIPKSGCNKITDIINGTLKIKIKSAPEKNKANKELIKYLGKIFKVPGQCIIIVKGKTSPLKTIKINLNK